MSDDLLDAVILFALGFVVGLVGATVLRLVLA